MGVRVRMRVMQQPTNGKREPVSRTVDGDALVFITRHFFSSPLHFLLCFLFFSLQCLCVSVIFLLSALLALGLRSFFFIGVSKRGRFFSIGRTPQKRRPFATFHCSHTTTYFLSLSLSISFRSLSLFIQSMCVYCLPWRDPFQFPRARSRAYTREQQQQQQIKNKKKRTKKQKTNNARRVYQIYLLPRPPFGVYMFYDVILFGCCLCFLRRFVCRSSFVFVFFCFFLLSACVCVKMKQKQKRFCSRVRLSFVDVIIFHPSHSFFVCVCVCV